MASQKYIWGTQLTDTKSTDVEGVGRIRIEDDGKVYRWVQNAVTNWTPGPGSLVCHAFTDTANALKKITQPATATLGFLGGVAVTTISASTGTNPLTYGWIQILGLNASVSVTPVNTQTTAAPVAGNSLIAVNAVDYAATGQAMGTAAIYTRNLELLESVTASTAAQTSINVYINCL